MLWTFIEQAARKKLGVPREWIIYSVNCMTGGVLVKGGIPRRRMAKGKRKGLPDWKAGLDHEGEVIVSEYEVKDARNLYESTTGNCGECEGTGKVIKSVGVDGTFYKPCHVCDGSGKLVMEA